MLAAARCGNCRRNLLGTQLQTVFIVEDDDLTRTSLVRRVTESRAGLQVTTAVGTCREIRAALKVSRPSVLLVDLGLPDGDGSRRHP
jgi:DNA-binding response OmpR family regulator